MVAFVLASTGVAWYSTGVLGFLLWLTLLIFCGIKTLRNGRWLMFLVGLVIPIFWIFGLVLGPRD
jgi:hypothetical protein